MKLLPAIDLSGGRCVRLTQGDFARETAYAASPQGALERFHVEGAEEAHLVDLDGARARGPKQHDLFVRLAAETPLKLQVAGGVRTADHVQRLLDAGIQRVVIGSLALNEPEIFAALLDRFGPERLTLALDVRLGINGHAGVASHGWLEDSGKGLDEVLAVFPTVHHLLVTDIGRDGMLSGPNVPLMRTIVERYPAISLQASGGVAELGDLDALRQSGAARAIVGKAIWEGRFNVSEGVVRARG